MRNEIVKSTIPNTPVHIGVVPIINRKKRDLSSIHLHDEIEILRETSGAMGITIMDTEYRLNSGEVIFINSRIPHATKFIEDNSAYNLVQFSVDKYSDESLRHISKYLNRFINSNDNPTVLFKNSDENTAEIRGYIDDITREHTLRNRAYELYIKGSVYKILGFLYRNNVILDESKFFDINSIDKVIYILNYIDENYQSQITLESLSKIAGLNESYFCRLFKKATHSTFTEYLNFVRVCKAEKLLITTSGNISEISSFAGFSSVSYFNRVFKKYKSITPSEYKKIKFSRQ